MSRPRLLHVITGLGPGGAETLLVRVLEHIGPDSPVDSVGVISLAGPGTLNARVEATGAPVTALELGRFPSPPGLARLRSAIGSARPDLIQTWLLHANVLGGLAARTVSRAPIVWGVHITEADPAVHGRSTVAVQRAERGLSGRMPARIIACSESSTEAMRRFGYPMAKVETIPNGFDIDVLHPDAGDRAAVRAELGLGKDELVVGHIARFHPMKDQANLLAAARRVCDRRSDVRFVLAGRGLDSSNPDVAALVAPLGDRVVLLGQRDDTIRLYRAFDLLALSSAAAEALPLVVGEAMASGVPVVATDCGDSPFVIGDTGSVVPVRDSAALADAMLDFLDRPAAERRRIGGLARERIETRYPLDRMVAAYEDVWERTAAGRAPGP